MTSPTTYNNLTLPSGVNLSYIEAGSPQNPTLLLLHGFPSSSNQFRNLIPLLAASYHILAPDFPGYGHTTSPADFVYTFSSLTSTISAFLTAINISRYAVYIFDYGAPVGLRLALEKPESVAAIISQNGNAYVEGFGHPFWTPIEALWNSSNGQKERDIIRGAALTEEATKAQYTTGVPESDLPLINPVAWSYDYHQNDEGRRKEEIQLDLLYDYRTNVPLYPDFQRYFRDSKVPILAIWGKGDVIFIPPGAEAFKKDAHNSIVKFVDSGHFALETKGKEIAEEMLGFLKGVKF